MLFFLFRGANSSGELSNMSLCLLRNTSAKLLIFPQNKALKKEILQKHLYFYVKLVQKGNVLGELQIIPELILELSPSLRKNLEIREKVLIFATSECRQRARNNMFEEHDFKLDLSDPIMRA